MPHTAHTLHVLGKNMCYCKKEGKTNLASALICYLLFFVNKEPSQCPCTSSYNHNLLLLSKVVYVLLWGCHCILRVIVLQNAYGWICMLYPVILSHTY